MLDFEQLIGQTKENAVRILNESGYYNIDFFINSKANNLCDSLLVCKVEKNSENIRLILGEFYLNIKE